MEIETDTILLSEYEIQRKAYVKDFRYTGNKAVFRINPNDFCGHQYTMIGFIAVFHAILTDLYIENYSFRRMDIAIDTVVPYDDIYKICAYFKSLYALYLNTNNSYRTNGDDFTKRSLKVSHRGYELEIYNKELESGGCDKAKTRIEFRYKRLRKSHQTVAGVIHSIIGVLQSLPNMIEPLNQLQSKRLIDNFNIERQAGYEGRTIGLSEYVSKYADFIYTTTILKRLHNSILCGECKGWLYRYRARERTLTLFSKSDIRRFIVELTSALRRYVKSDTAIPLFLKSEHNERAMRYGCHPA